MTRSEAVLFLVQKPYQFGHLLGFTKLTELHNEWIIDMVKGREDTTLQAHRGSYKTTCVSIALSIIIILFPNDRTFFLRKTTNDVKEIMQQVKNILAHPATRYFIQCIWGVDLEFDVNNAGEILTNLCQDTKGTAQLSAQGVGGSLTGKHFDRIFTDDIVNKEDRASKAERDKTKLTYQELQNVKNRGGRIYNTGTPWHPDDAFTVMPEPKKFDVYSTGLISKEEQEELRSQMTASLFAANYELKHIAAEDVLFYNPQTDGDPRMVLHGIDHIDAAYGGEDFTAYSVCNVNNGKYYIFGKLWHKHVDDCLEMIFKYHADMLLGRLYTEDNGDKGYLAKEIRRRSGVRAFTYHENMNKYIKITSYLKAAWKDVIFVKGTDEEYINQICDYTEEAEHDDAPDSAASILRLLWRKSA